jgi:hypothetical protein
MSRFFLAVPVLLGSSLAGCLSHIGAKEDSGSLNIRWLEDFESARQAAASVGRPILAVLVAGELKDKC